MSDAPVKKLAVISPCETYRYSLHRIWGPGLENLVRWIMLNPSTATAELDDPTIRRCCGFAKAWGYDGIVVHNLYALRATDPTELKRHPDPVGPNNDDWLSLSVTPTVCAWGAHADTGRPGRAAAVLTALRDQGIAPMCLGRTKAGHPRHPLYLAAATELEWM